MRLSVSEVTMLVNAPPMITPIAMSITLLRSAKALNSSINFFTFTFPFLIYSISLYVSLKWVKKKEFFI